MLARLKRVPGRVSSMQTRELLMAALDGVLTPAAVIPRPPQMMELHEPVLPSVSDVPRGQAAVLLSRWSRTDRRNDAQ
jgi:hypothetical protein